ncbi:MAG: hypothetical protein H7144_13110 [Burkholderiales bacterium]|nr:hypothetical protein [Phycisphaerae bacterium]
MKTRRIFVVIVISAMFTFAQISTAAPVLTPGQDVSVREGDTWSEAKFVRVEGRKYLVKYPDGTEEWITADRLRVSGDVGTGETSPVKPAGTPANTPAKPAAPGGTAISLEGPFAEIELRALKGVDKRASGVIAVKPTTRPSAAFTDLTPSAGVPFTRVEELIICPDTPGIVVAVGGRQGDVTPLTCIDINTPANTESRALTAHEHRIVTAADAGRVVVTRPESFGSQTLHLWEYLDGQYHLRANYTFVAEGKNRRSDEAILLSPTRLLVRSGGDNFLIDLRTRKQIAFIQSGDIKLHASGQILLTSKGRTNLVLRPSDLAILAELGNGQSSFSIDPTGTYVAAGNGRSVTVGKLATKTQTGQIGGLTRTGKMDLVGPDSLIVDGAIYYDLKTGIPVWRYKASNDKSVMLPNGQMLYVATVDGRTMICMTTVPDASAAGALTEASPEKFVISPGARIAIVGDLGAIGDAAAARKNLETAISSAGHKADDTATQFKLTVTTEAGPTGKFAVREFQMGGPPVVREVDAPSTIVTTVLTKDEGVIWKRELKFSAQVIINRRQDESLEQAVAAAGKPNPTRLGALDIPGYVVKPEPDGKLATLGESTLTRIGFVADKPADD